MPPDDSAFRRFAGRKHIGTSARRLIYPLARPVENALNNVRGLADQPFIGVTTDGHPIPGLFPIKASVASTTPIREATLALLASLSPQQKALACHPIDSVEWRKWLNAELFAARHGAMLEDMDDAQRELVLGVMRTTLSERGYREARNVMKLNEFLMEYTGDREGLGEWLYFISIFGTPSPDQPWGWQIDGHHLVISCFVLGDQMVLTPMFLGGEPLVADSGKYAGTRIFDDIQQTALEMVRSLSPAQRGKAILYSSMLSTDLPPERDQRFEGRQRMGAFRDNAVMPYEGIRAGDLTPPQVESLLGLIGLYAGYAAPAHAQAKMTEIANYLDDTWFAGIGRFDDEHPFYTKIQSPVIAIEFDHHRGVYLDNPEAERFHAHVIIRTPNGNDYGKALLNQFQEKHP